MHGRPILLSLVWLQTELDSSQSYYRHLHAWYNILGWVYDVINHFKGRISLDFICSSKLAVFLELRPWKTVRLSEQIMSADKYPSIFSSQIYEINKFDRLKNDELKIG